MQSISSKYAPMLVSVVVSVTFGMVMYFVLTQTVPEANSQVLLIMIGVLASKFGDVVAFWMGSSSGSKAKDDVISSQAKSGP